MCLRSLWEWQMPDGTTARGAMLSLWVVPVGTEARNRVNQSRTGNTAPDLSYTGEVVGKVTIIGQAILKSNGQGVAGAHVQLWREEGGSYYKDDWVTGTDGNFRITADGRLRGSGFDAEWWRGAGGAGD